MRFVPNGISKDINIITDKKELQRILDGLKYCISETELVISSEDMKLVDEIEEIIKVN